MAGRLATLARLFALMWATSLAACLEPPTQQCAGLVYAAESLCSDGNSLSHDGCGPCVAESPTWRIVERPLPPQRSDHAMAYDVARDRLVLFGGEARSGFLGDTWEWDGARWRDVTPSTSASPSARKGMAMAYDTERERIVLFGGVSRQGIKHGDTWLWDGDRWAEVVPETAPPVRDEHAMVYDGRRKRVVLFGGNTYFSPETGFDRHNDTWEWDGETWTQAMPASAPPRLSEHAMAYDAARGRVVVVGGTTGVNPNHDLVKVTWEWDGESWLEREPAPWSLGRRVHTATYDARRGAVIVFGGAGDLTGDRYFRDTWEWNGTAWAVVPIGDAPTPVHRGRHGAAYDARRGRVVMFGGAAHEDDEPQFRDKFDDMWLWEEGQWYETGIAPPAREYHAAAYDGARGTVVAFGGLDAMGLSLADTWVARRTGWIAVAPGTSPPERHGHAMAFDAARQQVVAFGGFTNPFEAGVYPDTWLWNGDDWREASPVTSPRPRGYTAMAYDRARERIVLFGGWPPNGPPFADTWEWDGDTWTDVTPGAGGPSARFRHAMTYDARRRRVVLYGGEDATGKALGDTWEWDGVAWTNATPAVSPPPQADHSLAYDAATGAVVLLADAQTWEWDGAAWSRVAPVEEPGSRIRTIMVYDGTSSGILMFGGRPVSGPPDADAWVFRYDSDAPDDECQTGQDLDGDGRAGCEDPDCWAACTPACLPGAECDARAPRCGDGVCNPALETSRLCPDDCAPPGVCGDFVCDAAESESSCLADCG